MRSAEKLAPVAAVASALSCMACCLPLGFAAAAGAAGFGVAIEPLRPWLMTIAVVLLGFSVWQVYRRPKVCQPRSRASVALLWVCAGIVVTMVVAPQLLAGLLA